MPNEPEAVRALLAAGVGVDSRGEHGGTALHWACWKGYPVELLLANGASLMVQDTTFQGTPAGWLDHGRENGVDCGSDHAQVEQVLRAAGAKLD